MRIAAVLLIAFACSGAFASESGAPIDCSDWVSAENGFHCEDRGDEPRPPDNTCFEGPHCGSPGALSSSVVSVEGDVVWEEFDGVAIAVYRRVGSETRLVGSIAARTVAVDPQGSPLKDVIRPTGMFFNPDGNVVGYKLGLLFDPVRGRLLISVTSTCNYVAIGQPPTYYCGAYANRHWLLAIGGFAALFDVLPTYAPAASSLGFRVPYMPEGMASADHFDTYWGNLGHPIDFTQAHPLQCNYPAAAPHVGDYLTVADTVPTPAPGQGVYYVTSATYQGARRYGRKTTDGHLSGRDPAVLPACTTP